ncbi:hypothetical protein EON83_11290 [bacterium]|nr:MAG: hypothetical protein EON83_11290 [bacterium]
MDPISLVFAFVQREAFTAASDAIKKRPVDLYMKEYMVKARSKTANKFPDLKELSFVLERWNHSERFENLFKSYFRDSTSVVDEMVFASFREAAKDYSGVDLDLEKATEVVVAFFKELHDALLRSTKEAIPYAASIMERNFAQIEEKVDDISDRTVAKFFDEMQRRGMLSNAVLTAPETGEEFNRFESDWKAAIDIALQMSDSNDPEEISSAKVTVRRVRATEGFEQATPVFRSRVATIAAKCADAQGDTITAEKEVDKALTLTPDNVDCLANAASVALIRGDFPRAANLALKAREFEPSNLNAAVVLVQAWPRINQPDMIEEFLSTEKWFLETSRGCTALAQVRALENRIDEAVALCEKALEKDANDVDALELLSECLFRPIYNRVQGLEILVFDGDINNAIERALDAQTRAVEILEKSSNKARLRLALINRAAIRSARRQIADALSDCDEAMRWAESEAERDGVRLAKARILISTAEYEKARGLLEELTTQELIIEGKFALGYCYYSLRRLKDAVSIWQNLWDDYDKSAPQFSPDELLTADILLDAYSQLQNVEKARIIVEELENDDRSSFTSRAIVAQQKYLVGDSKAAFQELQDIASAAKVSGAEIEGQNVLLRLADLYYRAGLSDEAAKIWEQLQWKKASPALQIHYLVSLRQANRNDAEVLEVAEFILSQGFYITAAEVAVSILSERKEWLRAKPLVEALVREKPDAFFNKLVLSQILVNIGEVDKARATLEEVSYDRMKNDANLLRQVSNLALKVKSKDAIRFAFRARQIEFSNPESQLNFFEVFRKSTDQFSIDEDGNMDDLRASTVLGINGPKWGTVPCTIRLLPVDVTDDRQEQSFTILQEGPFDETRGIYSANSEFAKQLLALKKDDTISLAEELRLNQPPVVDERLYQVSSYIHPYVHAFQEIIKLSSQDNQDSRTFGARAGMVSMDIRGNLKKLWDLVESAERDFKKLTDLYGKYGCPLRSVGATTGKSTLDLWFRLSSLRPRQVTTTSGAEEEFEKTVANIGEKGEKAALVLDSTAIISLVQAGLETYLAPQFRFVIPASLEAEIKSWADEDSSKFVPPGFLDRILVFVNDSVEVLPVTTELTLSPSDVRKWQRFIGRSELDVALLANEQGGLLYAEDWVLRLAATIQPKSNCVATHHLVEHLRRTTTMGETDFNQIIGNMMEANIQVFAFIQLDENVD